MLEINTTIAQMLSEQQSRLDMAEWNIVTADEAIRAGTRDTFIVWQMPLYLMLSMPGCRLSRTGSPRRGRLSWAPRSAALWPFPWGRSSAWFAACNVHSFDRVLNSARLAAR